MEQKKFNLRWLFLLIPVIIIIIMVIMLPKFLKSGDSKKDVTNNKGEIVVFNDEIVSLAVHDALGKEAHEDIYSNELAEIETLCIDDSYAVAKCMLEVNGINSVVPCMEIDVSEIAKLENLKELTIDNDVYDTIYCLSALTECKKLESLTLYYITDYSIQGDGVYTLGHGCKDLLSVVEGCPELKYINTVYSIPQELKDSALAINPNIEFYTKNGLSEEDGYQTTPKENTNSYVNVTNEGMVRISIKDDPIPLDEYLNGDRKVALKIDSNLSDNYWDIIVNSNNVRALYITTNIDLTVLKDMDSLECLSIAGKTDNNPSNNTISNISNLDNLGTLENLTSLSLFMCNIDGDLKVLDDIPNLKFLSYWSMENELPTDLELYSNLIGFEYYGEDTDPNKYFTNMSNLRKLKIAYDTDIDISNMNNLSSLYLCPLPSLENDIDMSMLNNVTNLRNLYIRMWSEKYKIDWANFNGLNMLENICCRSCPISNPETLANCKNLKRVYLDLFEGYLDIPNYSLVEYDLSGIADLEYLSYFGVTKNDMIKADYANYSGIIGLKKMNDNNVYINVCSDRYIFGRENKYILK